jgi:hypothetical protein
MTNPILKGGRKPPFFIAVTERSPFTFRETKSNIDSKIKSQAYGITMTCDVHHQIY